MAFLGVQRFDQLPRLLRRLETQLGGALTAFEVMWDDYYQLVTTEPARGRPILADRYPYYVLVEASGADLAPMEARFETVLAGALEDGEADDAVIAKTKAEGAAIWALRDDVGQTGRNRPDLHLRRQPRRRRHAGLCRRPARDAGGALAWTPTCVVFGHLGDGNLHVIVGVGASDGATRHAVEEVVYGPLGPIGGSISRRARHRPAEARLPAAVALAATRSR